VRERPVGTELVAALAVLDVKAEVDARVRKPVSGE